MEILNGRYGPYITYKGSNYKIPKDVVPADLNYKTCLEIIKLQSERQKALRNADAMPERNSHTQGSRLKARMIQNLPTFPRSVQHLYHLCFYFPNYYSSKLSLYCISLPDKQNKQSMKKVILAVASIALWASCIEDEKDYSQIIETRVANCETSQDFDVPIKEGYTTFVTYGEDTIAVANEPITIRIPKNTAVSTRAGDGINISYDVLKEGAETTYAKTWQAVMFEDTQNGDYDYNDLIIHVQNTASNHAYQHPDETWQSIKIQPIALGSIKTIKLGCILSDGSEHIISNDVRTDLFSGKQGFINTVDDNTPIRYRLSSTNIQNYAFAKTEQKQHG